MYASVSIELLEFVALGAGVEIELAVLVVGPKVEHRAGDVFLFSSDEELYSSKNGGKKVKIHDEIDDIDMSGTTIYLWTDYDDGEFTFSALTKGSKFKEIDLG